MRKIFASAFVALVSVSSAMAEDQRPNTDTLKGDKPTVENSAEKPSADELSFLRIASVVKPGEILAPGELLKINRDFSYWSLRCEIRLTKNRHSCFVEQVGQADGSGLVWRIAMNEQNKPIAMITGPADIDLSKGIRMKFAGLEKTLDNKLFRCGQRSCIGGFHFEGFVQAAISDSDKVGFSFTRKGKPLSQVEMPMTGFSAALAAGGRDPLGRTMSAKAAKDAKDKKASDDKKAKAEKVSSSKPVPVKRPAPADVAKPEAKAPVAKPTETIADSAKPAPKTGLF